MPRGNIPRNIPRLIPGGPLKPLGIELIGPPLPMPRPLKIIWLKPIFRFSIVFNLKFHAISNKKTTTQYSSCIDWRHLISMITCVKCFFKKSIFTSQTTSLFAWNLMNYSAFQEIKTCSRDRNIDKTTKEKMKDFLIF